MLWFICWFFAFIPYFWLTIFLPYIQNEQSKQKEEEAEEEDLKFTVLSWNIDGLEESCLYERLLGAIQEINKLSPDVVLLQEVVDETCLNLVLHLSK